MDICQDTKTDTSIQDYCRKIDNAITDYCHLEMFGNDGLDLTAATTAQFNGCLMYIANTVFKRIANTISVNSVDYNNSSLLYGLLDKYISTCYIYNKIPSSHGFYLMVGMSTRTYYKFVENDNPEIVKIVKTLNKLHEHGLIEKLEDSKSPVGQIAVGNVVHNWDGRKAISGNDSRMIESNVISSKYLQLADPNDEIVSDSSTIPELPSNDLQ